MSAIVPYVQYQGRHIIRWDRGWISEQLQWRVPEDISPILASIFSPYLLSTNPPQHLILHQSISRNCWRARFHLPSMPPCRYQKNRQNISVVEGIRNDG